MRTSTISKPQRDSDRASGFFFSSLKKKNGDYAHRALLTLFVHCLPNQSCEALLQTPRYSFLVFTKSVDNNFSAFWLASLTRNIIRYSLFCDRRQDGVSFREIFGGRNLSDKWSSHTSKYQKSDERNLVGVYWLVENYFLAEFATKSQKRTWQNPRNVCKL